GMIFRPCGNPKLAERCTSVVESLMQKYQFPFFGWRKVPVNPLVLGYKARETQPEIQQVLMGRPEACSREGFERTLYLVRREIENALEKENIESFYIPSFSSRTIVYKGLFVASELKGFYLDLQRQEYETALAVFHQRYSTNTFPTWPLAQPFRRLAHNGEINTLQGNINWMKSHETRMAAEVFGEQIEDIKPVIQVAGSDSASLDTVFELLLRAGRSLP